MQISFFNWNSESCLPISAFPATGRFVEVNGRFTDGKPGTSQKKFSGSGINSLEKDNNRYKSVLILSHVLCENLGLQDPVIHHSEMAALWRVYRRAF